MSVWRLPAKRELQPFKDVLIADNSERIEKAFKIVSSAKRVGVDTEFGGFNMNKESPVGKAVGVSAQFSADDQRFIFVPNWGPHQGNIRHFKKWLEDPTPTKVYHNAKADLHVLANLGITPRGLKSDTMIMDFTYNTAYLHGLKECIKRYFHEDTKEYGETFREPKPLKRGGFSKTQKFTPSLFDVVKTQEGITKLIDYAVKDPWYTLRLEEYLIEKLSETPWIGDLSMWEYYKTFELPYTEVLFEIERNGNNIDVKKLKEISQAIEEDASEVMRTFFKACVKQGLPSDYLAKFKMSSPKQVGELFEKHLGCHFGEDQRTKTGLPQTSDQILRKLKGKGIQKLVNLLMEQRRLVKLNKTYVKPFIEFHKNYNGKIHTTLKQASTRTARLSSSTPNLQNIPTHIKDKYGVRGCFVAEKEDEVVGDIDLSQIEMRVAAHQTKDKVMLEALNKGWDLHSLTTTRIDEGAKAFMAGRPPTKELLDEVKEKFKDARDRKAKIINFGVLYSMGPSKYADMSGSTPQEGMRAIDEFFTLFSGIKRGMKEIQRFAHKHGYIKTYLRRRIYLPGIRSEVVKIRRQAERQAFNYVVQGGAGELLKMAMILIWKDERLRRWGVRMTLQVHDELLFRLPKKYVEKAKPIIEDYVSHPYRHWKIEGRQMKDLLCDTPAEFSWGNSWSEAK